MSTKNTTLQDFTNSNDTEPPAKEKEDHTDSPPKDDQSGETPSAESLCPCYTEEVEKCRNRLDRKLIQDLNIEKIGCGYGVDYISGEVGATLAEGSARGYVSYLRQYVEFLHKNQTQVVEAEFREVKQYFNRLAKLNRAESTIEGHRSAITNLYKHISIYTDAEAKVNWATIREEIDPSSYRTPAAREREPLEKSEIKALYDAMSSFRNRLMIQVAVELGPRNVDIRSIKIDDVDFENKEIELSNTKSGGSYSAPITNQLLLLLRRWVDEERAAHPKADTTDYLFPSKLGGMLGSSGFCRIVKKAAEQAGIQEKVQSESPLSEREKKVLGTNKDYPEYNKVTPHTLRHTFNYLLQEAGIPREHRSKALDHNSEEVTKEFYDHNESNYQELMRELFSNKSSLLD